MKAIGKWSVEHRVSVNLIMWFIILTGLFRACEMRREIFPQFSLDMIAVSVLYPGASPEEVEEGICIKIEERLKSIEDVKTMYSDAYEGRGEVVLELKTGTDIREKLDEVKTEIDLIDSFPDEAEDPVVIEIKNNDPTIYLAVYGDAGEKALRDSAERIRDDLVEKDNISLATMLGTRRYEISVEVSEQNLREYNLSFEQVAAAVRSGSLDLPGGRIKTKGGEFLVRAKGKLYSGEEFEQIPVLTREDGTIIRLADVATVKDDFEDVDHKTRFNGKPAALVIVSRTDSQDAILISKEVKEYLETRKGSFPQGVNVEDWFDTAQMVQERIDLLLKNGLQGIVLVFIVLALFLNLGLSFWVASGIPISFMGAFLVLNYFGASINMLSMFAFIMTLGILVDDAIIVGENVYTHYSKGKSSKDAVIDSIAQIGPPVVMAVTTTMVAFAPLMYISGIMGKFIFILPQAVICILAISLVEAFIILPAHLEHSLTPSSKNKGLITRIFSFWFGWLIQDIKDGHTWLRSKTEKTLNRCIHSIYTPMLKYCVKNRYFTLAIAFGVLIASIGLLAGGHVPFLLFGKTESNWMVSDIIYPLGTPFETTEKSIGQIESGAFAMNEYFRDRVKGGKDIVSYTYAGVGNIPRRDWKPPVYGGHCGHSVIEVVPASMRPDVPGPEIVAKWREFSGEMIGVEQLTFSTIGGGPAGNPIEVQLIGDDLSQLQLAAAELKKEIATYPGTFDITDNFRPGKMEKQIHIKKGAKPLGITMADIATQIRQAYYGDEVLKVQRGKDDIKVMVRYSQKERESEGSVDELRIRTRDGRQIPLNQVADIEMKRGYSTIQRVDRSRVITVISDINEDVANAQKIVGNLKAGYLDSLVARYPGVSYDLEGQAKMTKNLMDDLKIGFSVAVMLMFLLLASQFKSYVQPVIIMTAIPFGMIGAIVGHFVMEIEFTMFSIFGTVALSGIVVNDSLILIDFINSQIRSGARAFDSVIEAGKNRFRPVLLTSVTTIAGLLPLLLETSFQAQFLIPMAVSISFGLMAATILTLLFVPSLYMIVRDVTFLFVAKDESETVSQISG